MDFVALMLICGGPVMVAGLSWLILRSQCRRLASAIRMILWEGDRPRPLQPCAALLGPVIKAVNELIETCHVHALESAARARELEIQLKVVTAERQDAQAVLQSISDAVLVTDPFDDLVMANESAARVFGFDAARAGGRRLEDVIPDETVRGWIRDMRQSRSSSGRRVVEHQMKLSADAMERAFKITLSCVADRSAPYAHDLSNAGASSGVVTVLHDMTREKKVAQEKNEFVSSVAHELRTPLAGIKAYVEMLIDGEAEDEKTSREFYEVIQGEANRLARLIDNILSISRIESGLIRVNKCPQSLTVIVKEAIDVIAPQAKTKNIAIVEKLSPVFYQTLADRDMIYQALLNLLGNAVKYTPEGGTVTVETVLKEAQRLVQVRITDTGVGIPPKDVPFVFDKFYRSEANNHMAKGTGLGLALVKHIVETVHKGRILFESEVGKGSCFGIELELVE